MLGDVKMGEDGWKDTQQDPLKNNGWETSFSFWVFAHVQGCKDEATEDSYEQDQPKVIL